MNEQQETHDLGEGSITLALFITVCASNQLTWTQALTHGLRAATLDLRVNLLQILVNHLEKHKFFQLRQVDNFLNRLGSCFWADGSENVAYDQSW